VKSVPFADQVEAVFDKRDPKIRLPKAEKAREKEINIKVK